MRKTAAMSQPGQPPARAQRFRLDGALAVGRAVELVAGDDAPSVLTGQWCGVTALVASAPLTTAHPGSSPADQLDRLPAVVGGEQVSVGGGWVGLIGYTATARIVDPRLGQPPVRERLPASALSFYDHVVVRDGDGVWWFEELWTEQRADDLRRPSQPRCPGIQRATGQRSHPRPGTQTLSRRARSG